MKLKWKIAFAAAIVNDFIDLIGIGAMPLIGDVLDALTGSILIPVTGWKSLPGFLEFIPFLDYLPLWTLSVLWAYTKENKIDIKKLFRK